MANYCDFSLKAKGEKENLLKLIEIFNNDYDKEHFWRIFDCSPVLYDDYIEIGGSCAWSVHSCMFNGEGTYQRTANKEARNTGIPHHGVTIPEVSKKLDLIIEIVSCEPGIGFEEHYVISKGDVIVDECLRYFEISRDDIINSYNDEHEIKYDCDSISDDELEIVLNWYEESYDCRYLNPMDQGYSEYYSYSELGKDWTWTI